MSQIKLLFNQVACKSVGTFCVIAAAVAFQLIVAHTVTHAAERPNVLFIAIDDLNDWVGCLGGHPQAKTPNIDRLAKRGTLFTNAHCQAPICGPSRASLLSGRYPHSTGVYQQPTKKPLEADRENFAGQLMPEYFAKHGYQTLGGGKITHRYSMQKAFQIAAPKFGGSGPKPGDKTVRFNYSPDLSIPFTGTQTDWAPFPDVDEKMPDHRAASWASSQLASLKDDQPFFLAVGFVRPHVPFYVPQKWFDMFPLEQVQLPNIPVDDLEDVPEMGRRLHELTRYPQLDWLTKNDNDQLRKCVQAYLACTTFVDHQVGRVLEALEKSGHADNTILVLFSDHGYHLGEKHRVSKHSLWEESTRVPLIISKPKQKKSATCKRPVGLIDLYPTLLELCDLPARKRNEGASLAPLLNDTKFDWRGSTLTTYGRANHAVRTDRYRYISYEDGSEELYDHDVDPQELKNIAREKSQQETLVQLRTLLPKHDAPYHAANSSAPINAWFKEHFEKNRLHEKDLEPIFDGKSLANWSTQDGKDVPPGWTVEDTVIRMDKSKSRGGNIVTRREYGDFDLSFEWKIAKGGNNGLKYRVRKYKGRMLGCEYQIYDRNSDGKSSTGSLYALYAPDESQKTVHPAGEYNSSRIVVLGNEIEHWLNGKLILRAQVGSAEWDQNVKQSKFSSAENFSRNRFGRIMLTDHGAEVSFRNMKIKTEDIQLSPRPPTDPVIQK